jgi:hypothetical protein
MHDGEYRKIRLAGDGNFGSRGGGLPLSWAFEVVLQEILDSGPSLTGQLEKIIIQRMFVKEKAIFARWGEAHGWSKFTVDILDELAERKLVSAKLTDRQEVEWQLGPEFRENELLEVFGKMKVRIRDRAARELRSSLARIHQSLFEQIAAGDRLGVHEGPEGVARREALEAAARLYEWREKELERAPKEAGKGASALVTLEKIRPELAGLLPEMPEPGRYSKRRVYNKYTDENRPPRPTAAEWYRRFGYTGERKVETGRRFDPDGRRECPNCGDRFDPDGFTSEWDKNKRNENGTLGKWYLRNICKNCQRIRSNDARVRRIENGGKA